MEPRQMKDFDLKSVLNLNAGPVNTTLEDLGAVDITEIFEFLSNGGIYILFRKTKIVYIGQTDKLLKRLYEHLRDKRIKFDAVKFIIENESQERKTLESVLIAKHQPPLNKRGKYGSGYEKPDCPIVPGESSRDRYDIIDPDFDN
jgi:GIY-YIG catalytic domain